LVDFVRFHRFVWLLPLSAFVLVLGGCDNQNGHKQAQMPAVEVGVVTIHAKPVTLTAELPGRTSPFAISDVRPQVNGIIRDVLFVQGSEVKAGQTMYQIDPALYQAAFDNAKATLASAQATLMSAKSLAERDARLVATNAISRQDNDNAQAAYEQAKAAVQQQAANLETARINLAYTKVTAPIGGRAGISTVTKGALVTANQTTALTTVQTLDPMYVDIAQSSTQLLALRQEIARGRINGDAPATAKVSLILPDGSRYAEEGKLQFTDITVDPATGAVTLRALFPNPHHLLLPGLYVRAIVAEGVDPNALLVPQQGIIRNTKGEPTAWVVGKDDKAELRTLQVSRAVGNNWLVTSGLEDGVRIVVEGTQKIRQGALVNPVAATLDDGSKTAANTEPGR
jgi:membrane fusion protein (multidrug efflux system)